ncbi:MAG: twin-arginine translocation signal domain-containing protein, partial [Kiritimatiellae bacterium]|nr:twin-arginine translocation signal domain-containing protein [Kiritimatiellia bacterium]
MNRRNFLKSCAAAGA